MQSRHKTASHGLSSDDSKGVHHAATFLQVQEWTENFRGNVRKKKEIYSHQFRVTTNSDHSAAGQCRTLTSEM
jgi:hypothetical protein